MSTFFYTTGQAARELGATQGQIRNLCQTGAIAAEITQGGQWRIPKAEVERLKGDGLPAVPRPLLDDHPRPVKKSGGPRGAVRPAIQRYRRGRRDERARAPDDAEPG